MWPITDETKQELTDRLKATMKARKDAIIALWDDQTCFFMAVHVYRGAIVYTEVCGPISEAQADKTAAELGVSRSGVRELKAQTAH